MHPAVESSLAKYCAVHASDIRTKVLYDDLCASFVGLVSPVGGFCGETHVAGVMFVFTSDVVCVFLTWSERGMIFLCPGNLGYLGF